LAIPNCQEEIINTGILEHGDAQQEDAKDRNVERGAAQHEHAMHVMVKTKPAGFKLLKHDPNPLL